MNVLGELHLGFLPGRSGARWEIMARPLLIEYPGAKIPLVGDDVSRPVIPSSAATRREQFTV
jgi:hypothetical protein